MICNKCGASVAEDSEFCMACGSSVKDQTEQQEPEAQSYENQEQFNNESAQAPKRSKKKTLLCVIAVVLALAFVLGGISSAVAIFSGDGPISEIGEALENGIEDGFEHIALWSHRISFRHPETEERMEFSHLPPHAAPWDLFYGK